MKRCNAKNIQKHEKRDPGNVWTSVRGKTNKWTQLRRERENKHEIQKMRNMKKCHKKWRINERTEAMWYRWGMNIERKKYITRNERRWYEADVIKDMSDEKTENKKKITWNHKHGKNGIKRQCGI